MHECHRRGGGGFREIDGRAFDEKRCICENERNEGDTDVSVIGKHGAVFECFRFPAGPAADFPDNDADGSQNAHLDAAEEEDVQQIDVEFRAIDAVKNETGQHDVERQFRKRRDVQMKFPIHEVADDDKGEEGKDVVGDDVEKGHF